SDAAVHSDVLLTGSPLFQTAIFSGASRSLREPFYSIPHGNWLLNGSRFPSLLRVFLHHLATSTIDSSPDTLYIGSRIHEIVTRLAHTLYHKKKKLNFVRSTNG